MCTCLTCQHTFAYNTEQETQDRPAATRAKRLAKSGKKECITVTPVGTGAWPAQVGVQRVTWNTGGGLGRAPLLASATGSGLCRIDWLLGRMLRNKQSYGGIHGIRKEVESEGVDEESDD